jgi:hypothetical protein
MKGLETPELETQLLETLLLETLLLETLLLETAVLETYQFVNLSCYMQCILITVYNLPINTACRTSFFSIPLWVITGQLSHQIKNYETIG